MPGVVARAGKRGLALAQRLLYERALETRVNGANHVPQHTNFIVAANHASHLDMGVIKVALGDAGKDLTSLAAADYFFRNKYRRAFFTHFTNLVPMERSGSIRKSMDTAEQVLRRGRSMVVFPEGTRSLSGEMADFLPSLGYLALRAGVGILPAHISGAYEALPKGRPCRARASSASRSGRSSRRSGSRRSRGAVGQEGWRLVAAFTQRVVENLRDGVATCSTPRRRAPRGTASKLGRSRRGVPRRARSGRCREERRATLVTGGTGFLGSHLVSGLARVEGVARGRARPRAERAARVAARTRRRDRGRLRSRRPKTSRARSTA